MQSYRLDFILHAQSGSVKSIKSALAEFAEILEVAECEIPGVSQKDFRISMNTEDPTVIFDVCAQFGRIRSMKVNEAG